MARKHIRVDSTPRKPLSFRAKFAILALYLILGLIIAVPFVTKSMTKNQNSAKVAALSQELAHAKPTDEPFGEMATSLKIERLGIDVPVVDGEYNFTNQTWDLSGNKVHLGTMFDQINNTGGFSFMYGHNNRDVLGKTKQLIKNDIMAIFTTSGRTVYYAYDYDIEVKPDQYNTLTESRKPNYVALMTCNGLYDQNRRIMYFRYVGYEL
jgi:LPXTG-site transpeptidase (sortase) family protein